MKFPFVSRSRHTSALSRVKEEKERVEEKAAQLLAKYEKERGRTGALKKLCEERFSLCEDRLREMESLQSQMAELRRSRVHLLDQLSLSRENTAPYTGRSIPTIIGIDVEPDARIVDLNDASWRGTSELFRRLPELRRLLSGAAGGAPVRFTWFPRADPQVEKSNGSATWAFEQFKTEWEAVLAEGDEIGLHMHPWRWDEQSGGWCQDHADEAWVISCVRSSIEAYRAVWGKTPACYRGGDRYLSNAVVRVLEEEGVAVDLTLEKMPEVSRLVASERGTGVIPDGTSIPVRAFRPSPNDFRAPDPERTTGLAMLPLTSYEKKSLSPWLPNTVVEDELDRMLTHLPKTGPESLTHLAFVIRANLVCLPQWDDFVENALSLARRVRERRLAFATASESWGLIRDSLDQ